jgi:hypothetical protein
MMGTKWMIALMLGGAMAAAGCESKDETPSGQPAPVPQASEQAAEDMRDKTEDASERAKAAAEKAGDATAKQAEDASDAIKKNADAAAESVAANPAAAESQKQLTQVMTYIRENKLEAAETTLKTLETNSASLPAAMQEQVKKTRVMLDTAKKGLGATTLPAAPKL